MVWGGAQLHGLGVSACPPGGTRDRVVVVALAWALKLEKGFCEAEKVVGR